MAGRRREKRSARVLKTLKRIGSIGLLLLAASCVPIESTYRLIPGKRDASITVPIPLPVAMPTVEQAGFDPAQLPALDAVTDPSVLGIPLLPDNAQPLRATTLLDPGPAATPYVFRGASAQDSLRAQLCLTAAIYYEAANEPDEGQRAVAQVVLNRVRHPAYPNTVCDVVYQGTDRGDLLCQFSFACDGSMSRVPARESWIRASRAARAALAGSVFPGVGQATHYHTLAVNPSWNASMTRAALVGAHLFFRWPGAAGQPGAFFARYTGREPNPGPRPHPIRPLILPKAPLGDSNYAALQAALARQSPLPFPTVGVAPPAPAAVPIQPRPNVSVAQDNRYVSGALQESQIRDEYRGSGQWITR